MDEQTYNWYTWTELDEAYPSQDAIIEVRFIDDSIEKRYYSEPDYALPFGAVAWRLADEP